MRDLTPLRLELIKRSLEQDSRFREYQLKRLAMEQKLVSDKLTKIAERVSKEG
ncbi:hypothetical protein [Gracilibacillus lacisalsi]|uniref:hypothetical protein n=1 Tax=Gracilibacillus lacisalsi TaxID=393087 RepID=UPI000361D2C1|nr:hypothetical protein [Gracilibacillus lacisalsi]